MWRHFRFYIALVPILFRIDMQKPFWDMLYSPVIQSVLLYNIFVLIQYLNRKIHIEIQVNCLKAKVTLTLKPNIFARAITMNVLNIQASYSIFETWTVKKAAYCSLRQKVKGQSTCDFLVSHRFWRNILISLHHRYSLLWIKTQEYARKTLRMSRNKKK